MKNIDIFPWNDHFNTDIEIIDTQHRKLVQLLNRLVTLIAYKSSEDALGEVINELVEYTLYHFETEESIWHTHLEENPLCGEHKAVHQKFIDTVQRIKSEQELKPPPELADETLGFLTRWLASHIFESDRYMAQVVKALQKGLNIDEAKAKAQEKMSGSNYFLVESILSAYSTLSINTLHLMRELQAHALYEKKVIYQNHYEGLLVELASSFINLPLGEIDTATQSALEKMAIFVGADRAYIFDFDFNAQVAINTHEWCAQGVAPQKEASQNIPLELISDFIEAHSRGEHFLIEDVFALPEGELRDILIMQDVQSLVTFALMDKNKCIGMVGFDAVREKHIFTKEEIALLKLFSALLANVAERKNSEKFMQEHNEILEMIASAKPASAIYDRIALMYEARNPGVRCSLLELENGVLLHGGAPSLPQEYCDAVHGLRNGPDVGSCGTSTFTGQRVLVADIATDSRWALLKDAALPHGMRSCWSEPITDSAGRVLGAFGMYKDYAGLPNEKESYDLKSAARLAGIVMERDHAQKELDRLAFYDPLTKLPNRRLFLDRLNQALIASARNGQRGALLFMDLDYFKALNDTLGHSIGDLLLQEVANRLMSNLRENDTAARFGGDEFVVLLENLSKESLDAATQAEQIAEKIQRALNQPYQLNEHTYRITPSIGMKLFIGQVQSVDELLKQADIAMYQAKTEGRDTIRFFDPMATS